MKEAHQIVKNMVLDNPYDLTSSLVDLLTEEQIKEWLEMNADLIPSQTYDVILTIPVEMSWEDCDDPDRPSELNLSAKLQEIFDDSPYTTQQWFQHYITDWDAS